jgi:hypothetical protein
VVCSFQVGGGDVLNLPPTSTAQQVRYLHPQMAPRGPMLPYPVGPPPQVNQWAYLYRDWENGYSNRVKMTLAGSRLRQGIQIQTCFKQKPVTDDDPLPIDRTKKTHRKAKDSPGSFLIAIAPPLITAWDSQKKNRFIHTNGDDTRHDSRTD